MRTLLSLLTLAALAGCVTPATLESTSTPDAAMPDATALPFHAEGTYWLKPSNSNDRATHEIPFTVNATKMLVVAKLTIGERYGPLELPTSTSDVEAELLAPDGTSLKKDARAPAGKTSMTLEGVAETTGEGKLVLRTFGGSDEGSGGGFGDYVQYVVDVK